MTPMERREALIKMRPHLLKRAKIAERVERAHRVKEHRPAAPDSDRPTS